MITYTDFILQIIMLLSPNSNVLSYWQKMQNEKFGYSVGTKSDDNYWD